MTVIHAEWRPAAQVTGAETRIVAWDTDAQELTTIATPLAGRAYLRPIVSSLGDVAWIETVAGGTLATASTGGSLWLNSAEIGRPDWVYWEHTEFSPDGTEYVHSGQRAGVDSGMRIFVTDLNLVVDRVLGDPGTIDPSWTCEGIAVSRTPVLGGERADWFVMDAETGTGWIPYSDEGARCRDPFLSPDANSMVWHRSTGDGVGTSGLRLFANNAVSWLVPPTSGVVQGPARWINNTTLITSRRVQPETFWSLYVVDLSGELTRLTDASHGSLSAPAVAPYSLPPSPAPLQGTIDWGDGTTTSVTLTPEVQIGAGELLVFGDSLSALNTAGNVGPGCRWPELLVGDSVVTRQSNFAFSGATTEWYQPSGVSGPIEAWQENPPVAPGPVDVLVLYFGANDMNTGVPSIAADLAGLGLTTVTAAEFNANLDWFLENYPADRQVVVFPWRWVTGPVSGVPVDESVYLSYRDAAAQAASDAGATFVDLGSLVPDATDYVRDWVHANAAGHRLVADAIAAVL